MRYLLRLPPLLRVAQVMAALCVVAVLILMLLLLTHRLPSPLLLVQMNLAFLSLACSVVVGAWNQRRREPGRQRRFMFMSWQSQARALALTVTPALCSLIVALVSANSPNFEATQGVVLGVTIVAGLCPSAVFAFLTVD